MARSSPQLGQGNNFLWLADIQEERWGNLYVDQYHHTAAFIKGIAPRICTSLQEKGFLAGLIASRWDAVGCFSKR